jgi:hypothetical protein
MQVKVDDSVSSSAPVESGVVQGSVLGPALFIAFINRVALLQLSDKSEMILYADDIVMTHPMDSNSAAEQIQSDIDQIYRCLLSLGLTPNAKKCKVQIFSLSKQKQTQDLSFKVGPESLQLVDHYRYLGIEFDNSLSFDRQTSMATSKAKQGIGALCRSIRKWASATILSTAITSITLPALLYAVEHWYPACQTQQRKIEAVQKYAARLVTNNFNQEATYEVLINPLGWRPIFRQVAEGRLLNMKRYREGTRYIPASVYPLKAEEETTIRRSSRIRDKCHTHGLQLQINKSHKNSREEQLVAAQTRLLWNALDETTALEKFPNFQNKIRSSAVYECLKERGALFPLTV